MRTLLVAALLLLAALAVWWGRARRDASPSSAPPADGAAPAPAASPATPPAPRARPPEPPRAAGLTAEEKAARLAAIRRDYDEIREKASKEFAAAGSSYPGGLAAFLRQLALLEREKRADFAAVLTPRELEDLELRETNAGQQIARLLGDTAANDEQRRAVFRLQREFEEKFALTFDVTPPALLERERSRQQTQEAVRETLGEELFAAWLRGEGGDYGNFQKFATEHGLAPGTALELWRAKNAFTLQRLELSARQLPPDALRAAQQAAAREARARVLGVLGPGVLDAAQQQILGWLPRE